MTTFQKQINENSIILHQIFCLGWLFLHLPLRLHSNIMYVMRVTLFGLLTAFFGF